MIVWDIFVGMIVNLLSSATEGTAIGRLGKAIWKHDAKFCVEKADTTCWKRFVTGTFSVEYKI
jgi:hypothetical protein